MDRLREMELFVAVIEQGSFSAASEKCSLSRPAVSHAIKSLENRLGVQLLARTTRAVRPTDAGIAYLEACRKLLDGIADTESSIAGNPRNPVGTLTITAPVQFGQRFVAPLVNAYTLRYPDVSVNAIYVDRPVRLLEEGVDVAIRIGHLEDSSTFAIRLGSVRRQTFASPAYLAAHGEPVHPRELTHHHCVSFTGVSQPFDWVFFEHGAKMPVRLRPRMIVNLAPTAISAAKDGVGITQLLSYQAAPEVSSGALVPILRAFEPESTPVSLLHIERRGTSAKIRSFVDFVTETLQQNPHLQCGNGLMSDATCATSSGRDTATAAAVRDQGLVPHRVSRDTQFTISADQRIEAE
ncbi:LysR family transcriptional regulator [Paraburkholderia sp. ZP32-5]|uniref:LysR family transcriptional regulator n=1 Tax=Paraburkholderia sp. ZP32-5 TaxID=2883245 RepID=UPI001F3FDEC3|nr:LysR family transcriptional regulator [Paraburkholderia sp. ZP32-5]